MAHRQTPSPIPARSSPISPGGSRGKSDDILLQEAYDAIDEAIDEYDSAYEDAWAAGIKLNDNAVYETETTILDAYQKLEDVGNTTGTLDTIAKNTRQVVENSLRSRRLLQEIQQLIGDPNDQMHSKLSRKVREVVAAIPGMKAEMDKEFGSKQTPEVGKMQGELRAIRRSLRQIEDRNTELRAKVSDSIDAQANLNQELTKARQDAHQSQGQAQQFQQQAQEQGERVRNLQREVQEKDDRIEELETNPQESADYNVHIPALFRVLRGVLGSIEDEYQPSNTDLGYLTTATSTPVGSAGLVTKTHTEN